MMITNAVVDHTSIEGKGNSTVAKCILIVEDDESIREFVSAFLLDEGFEVALAENGIDALKQVAKRRPALIFLDILMPLMGGHAFVEAYHELPGPHAPIIGMSANKQDTAVLSVLEGFISKPFDLEQLLGCIRQYVS
jgi:CheY-like chemotaxis protein